MIKLGVRFGVVLSTIWLIASPAHATQLSIKFDCALPSQEVDCAVLERAFFAMMGGLFSQESDEAKAHIVMKIREQKQDQKTDYWVTVVGKGPLPVYSMNEPVGDALSSDAKFNKVLAFVQQMAIVNSSDMLRLAEPGSVKDGQFTGKFTSIDMPTKPADTENWYINPNINFSYVESGITDLKYGGSMVFSYSTPKWRVEADTSASYHKAVIPMGPGQKVDVEIFDYSGRTLLAYSLPGKWSVAAMLNYKHSVDENFRNGMDATVGVEWSLMPFLKTTEKNITIRYTIGYHDDRYIDESVNGRMSDQYLKHALGLYFNWHFDWLDVGVSTGVDSPVNDYDYASYFAFGNVSIRLMKNVYFVPNAGVVYRKKLLNAPMNPDTNPVFTYLSGGAFSNMMFTAGASLKVYFGNPHKEDQRWKDHSDHSSSDH